MVAAPGAPKRAVASPVWSCEAFVSPLDTMTMSDMTRPR